MRPERGGRSFRPAWPSSLALGGLIVCFIALGNWQLNRAAEKEQIQYRFEQAPSYSSLPEKGQSSRYAEVRIQGRFDTERHLLIDNQVFQGRPGVHVLTPFQLQDGRWLLVNRGWLPLAPDRRSLPSIPTMNDVTVLDGKLDEIYRPGKRLGPADRIVSDRWPQLLTYPETEAIGEALGVSLYPLILLLDRRHPSGFGDREWKPVHTGAAKHRARALQWFTFVAAAIVIWIFLGFKRGNEP